MDTRARGECAHALGSAPHNGSSDLLHGHTFLPGFSLATGGPCEAEAVYVIRPWIQAVAATNVDGSDSSRSSSSAGVRKPRRLRGRALSSEATWSSQPGP